MRRILDDFAVLCLLVAAAFALATAYITTPAQADTLSAAAYVQAQQAQASAATRQPRLSIIADGEQNYGSAVTIATAGTFNTVRVLHHNLAPCTATGLRALVGNYGQATSSSVGTTSGIKERQNANAITGHIAFEFAGTLTNQTAPRTPVLWGGQPTITLGTVSGPYAFPNLALSDPAPGFVASGASFYERAAVTVATNSQVFQGGLSLHGGTSYWGTNSGEGTYGNSTAERVFDNNAGSPTSDVTIGNYTGPEGWSSIAILGTCADGTVAKSLAIFGDSIATSNDDAAYGTVTGGWPLRTFANYPHMLLTYPGERGQDTVLLQNSAARYWASQYATHVLWQYGRNDLSYDMGVQGYTAAQFLAHMQSITLQAAQMFMMPRGAGYPGQTFIAGTILPAPTSANGYLDVANQTKDIYEAGRVLYNDWIRNTGASEFVAQANAQVAGIRDAGVARFIDPCKGIEVNSAGVLTLDGGYVLPATTTFATGTSSGSNTTTTLNDTTKSWTANQFKGDELYIVSGTGAGQSKSIAYNTATQLVTKSTFTTTPDATSVYRVNDASGWDGVHPGTIGHVAITSALAADAVAVMK